MTPEIIFVKTMSVNDLFVKKGYEPELNKIASAISLWLPGIEADNSC